jgi:hypothetical protein
MRTSRLPFVFYCLFFVYLVGAININPWMGPTPPDWNREVYACLGLFALSLLMLAAGIVVSRAARRRQSEPAKRPDGS